jgi:dGTPase
MDKLKELAEKIDKQEAKLLSPFATANDNALRMKEETDIHYRPPYALDRDRIFYSGAFKRYTGKTQVIYFASMLDEQLTSRIVHTLSVAQIAKTIGRLLSLNTDLIDAIALGHDLGHPPFGHDGEKFLTQVSKKYSIGQFHHNIQSLRVVDTIAKMGRGMNLTFQTRDGILSHNGEAHNEVLEPNLSKSESDLLNYIEKMDQGENIDMMPATLEGCVVRLTDTIAYIGQDIEDAIRIGLIKREDLPKEAASVLGIYNGKIIETLVNDVVLNSYSKKYVCFSENTSRVLRDLKEFNYQHIYKSDKLKVNHEKIERGFYLLFEHYLDHLQTENKSSEIFKHFLDYKIPDYRAENSNELVVRDFVAGMTDRYFIKMLQKMLIPDISSYKTEN